MSTEFSQDFFAPLGRRSRTPFGLDDETRDYDREPRRPPRNPVVEAFGPDTWFYHSSYYPENAELFDEDGRKHLFSRLVIVEKRKILVDEFSEGPADCYSGDDFGAARENIQATALAQSAKVAEQLKRHNETHPAEQYGYLAVWEKYELDSEDVESAKSGAIVPLRPLVEQPSGGGTISPMMVEPETMPS